MTSSLPLRELATLRLAAASALVALDERLYVLGDDELMISDDLAARVHRIRFDVHQDDAVPGSEHDVLQDLDVAPAVTARPDAATD